MYILAVGYSIINLNHIMISFLQSLLVPFIYISLYFGLSKVFLRCALYTLDVNIVYCLLSVFRRLGYI